MIWRVDGPSRLISCRFRMVTEEPVSTRKVSGGSKRKAGTFNITPSSIIGTVVGWANASLLKRMLKTTVEKATNPFQISAVTPECVEGSIRAVCSAVARSIGGVGGKHFRFRVR